MCPQIQNLKVVLVVALCVACTPAPQPAEHQESTESLQEAETSWPDVPPDEMAWTSTRPLVFPINRADDHYHSIKDPSIVRHGDRWRLFTTIRGVERSHQIEYLSFDDWDDIDSAERHILELTDGYFCAPQVFFFRPHEKWYLVYQVVDESRKPALQPAFSSTTDLDDPESWSPPELLFEQNPENVKMWIDFWVISDDERSYLFFTSLDGKMWVAETAIGDFPHGWGEPRVVLEDDIYEASHTYKLAGRDQYLTFVEARNGSRRYFKTYLADDLGGEWRPLAATRDLPFVGPENVDFERERWSESFSHGEFLRSGIDERLEVDPMQLEMIYQGATDESMMEGRPYGEIPWRLGLLRPKNR